VMDMYEITFMYVT